MKKFNLYPLDTKTPFGRGYLLIVGCFLLSCTPVTKKTEPSKNYKVYEGNELIDKIAQSAKLNKADAEKQMLNKLQKMSKEIKVENIGVSPACTKPNVGGSCGKIYKAGIEYYYPHFNGRLKERYGFSITIDEYVELCKKDIELIYVLSPNKRFGVLKINDVDVWVIRCNAAKQLNTALHQKGTMPLPSRYRKMGISTERFNADLKFALETIEYLKDCFFTLNDKRKFFVEKPGGFPDWMYGAAYSMSAEFRHHFMVRVVKNLYRTERR